MTASRDPDRLIRAFLNEGEELLHDEVYDAVRAAIEQKRQRVVIGPWRSPTVSKFVTFGLGAAAVVVIGILLGSQLLGSSPEIGSPGGEPTTTPGPASPAGGLPLGPYRVVDSGAPEGAPAITVTIPAPGWSPDTSFGGLDKGSDEQDPPRSAMLLWSYPAGASIDVFGDPCHWESATSTTVSTVDELADALAAQPSRDASDPVDVTVGEHSGKHLILYVPDDIDPDFSDCDQTTFASYGHDGEVYRSHQGPGQIDELWILDVDGRLAILTAMYRPTTPTAVIEEMRTIAASATFGD